MSNFISIRNLHLYPLIEDTATKLSYGEGFRVPGLVNLSIEPSMAEGTYWADGIAYQTIKKLGEISITMKAAAMDLKTQAEICGHTYDETKGVVVCSANDTPPLFGMKYERVKADGTSRFITINKVLFSLQKDEGQTSTDSIEFQDTGDLSASAMPTINNNEWKTMLEENATNSTEIAKFFDDMISTTP